MDGQIFNHLNNKKSVKKNLTSSSYPTDSVGVRARACSQHMCLKCVGGGYVCYWCYCCWAKSVVVLVHRLFVWVSARFSVSELV